MTGETAQVSSASMTTPSRAVFLSYASEDAPAAQRIADALRAAGIDVWLDQSELRGGDAWDRQIRGWIHECQLFIALISAHSEARDEGYFRREWKLAVDRTHDMLDKKAFLLPVAIDATPERGAAVPDKFHEVQWTRLSGGDASPEFVARVKGLLSSEPLATARAPAGADSVSPPIPLTTGRPSPPRPAVAIAVAVLALAALAYLLINKPWISRPPAPAATSSATSAPGAPPAAFNPPPHSIAVLPFVNMSGDKEQEYFSDGLSEELINSLSRINQLQVAARTSAFSFKGKDTDIRTIATRLNVATVLEGSVRRSPHTVRVTAQLINAVSGYHLWSQTYDRDWGDVLKTQSEIANAVAKALLSVPSLSVDEPVTRGSEHLLGGLQNQGDLASKIELGGTRNPAAFDAYLRATRADFGAKNIRDEQAAIASYTEAIRLDPNYALAFAGRSMALVQYSAIRARGPEIGEDFHTAQADAHKAVALAPKLAEGHLALAVILEAVLNFPSASEEYEHALALAPGNVRVLQGYGAFAISMGHLDAGLAAARRAVTLDPLNRWAHWSLSYALKAARHYDEAIVAYKDAAALSPDDPKPAILGLLYYAQADYQNARAECEIATLLPFRQLCLAMTYDKLGRHADAEAMLAKLRAEMGNASACDYAMIYAQWGNTTQALNWLETAMRLRDSGLSTLKVNALLDPLRQEPRFQAIERELRFPD
jgi:TolB-like protein/tetratricopeptide (TPR) repeat protein